MMRRTDGTAMHYGVPEHGELDVIRAERDAVRGHLYDLLLSPLHGTQSLGHHQSLRVPGASSHAEGRPLHLRQGEGRGDGVSDLPELAEAWTLKPGDIVLLRPAQPMSRERWNISVEKIERLHEELGVRFVLLDAGVEVVNPHTGETR